MKNGSYALDENAKPIEVDKDDLKTKNQSVLKTGWEGATDGLRRATAGKSVFNSEKDSVNDSTHQGQDKQSGESDGAKKNSFTNHGTPPKQNSTGSNPSYTDNSTTGSDSKQPLSNADHARSELKLMAAEKQASLKAQLDVGAISPEEFKKQSAALGTLRANIDGGHAIRILSLKGAGFKAQDLEKAGHLHLKVSDLGTRQAGEPRSTTRADTPGQPDCRKHTL